MIPNNPISTSRERNLNLKGKRPLPESQKSDNFLDTKENELNAGSTRNAPNISSLEQARTVNASIPQVSKRRPLILRKNNFI